MRAHVGEFLDHDRVVEEVGARAAVLDRGARRDEALGTDAPPGLPVADTGLVPVRDPGHDLLRDEALHLLTEEPVVAVEDVAAHASA